MSLLKLASVISVSSEDKESKAENLLKDGKWLCGSVDDKQATVVLEIETPTKLEKLEIINDSSAFIEILVSNDEHYDVLLPVTSFMNPSESKQKFNMNRKKTFDTENGLVKYITTQKWKKLKVVCTQPFNKTIQYGLSSIKVYGLKDDNEKDEAVTLRPGIFSMKKTTSEVKTDDSKVGDTFSKWKDKKTSIQDEDEYKQKAKSTISSAVPPAAMTPTNGHKEDIKPQKAATKEIKKNEIVKNSEVKRKRTGSSDEDANSDLREFKQEAKKPSNINTKLDNNKKEVEKMELSSDDEKVKPKPKPKEEPKADKPNDNSRFMSKVVFVLSGFQNPERSNLRDKAIKMGAKYKQDWDDSCTHLICAFANTPKYNQVKEDGGIIVKKGWIDDCSNKNKLLNENLYAFESSPKKQQKKKSADDSDSDEDARNKNNKKISRRATRNVKQKSYKESDDDENSDDREFIADDSDEEEDDEYSGSDDESEEEEIESSDDDESEEEEENGRRKKKKSKYAQRKESDSSEDERQKPKSKPKPKAKSYDSTESENDKKENKKPLNHENKKNPTVNSDDDDDDTVVTPKPIAKKQPTQISPTKKGIQYGDSDDSDSNKKPNSYPNKKIERNTRKESQSSTDVNSDLDMDFTKTDKEPWELPDLFLNKKFFIYGNFKTDEARLLTRIIVAYGGTVQNYIADSTDFVITDYEWNEDFDKSLKDNSNLKFINSDWLEACATRKKLIAYEPFEVLPQI